MRRVIMFRVNLKEILKTQLLKLRCELGFHKWAEYKFYAESDIPVYKTMCARCLIDRYDHDSQPEYK